MRPSGSASFLVLASACALAGLLWASTGLASHSTASATGLTYARAQIAKSQTVPKFKAPGSSIDASAAKGKIIFNIPVASYLPFVVNVGKSMASISQKLGISFIDYPNQGQPSEWVQGIGQAIARKANLIVLNTGADPRLLGPQIQQAKNAGIAVLVVHQYALTDPVAPNITANVPAPFLKVGRLLADGAISATNGKTHALLVADNEYTSSQDIVRLARNEFRRHCPGCTLTVVSVPVAQWATKIQTTVQTALVRDKRINFVIPMFDAMQQWAVPAIIASGATNRVQTGSYNGDPAVLKRIPKIVNFTIGESADQLAYAYMDEALRILTGTKPIANIQTPIRFFDRTDVAQTGKPPQWSKGYGSDYVQGYEKLCT